MRCLRGLGLLFLAMFFAFSSGAAPSVNPLGQDVMSESFYQYSIAFDATTDDSPHMFVTPVRCTVSVQFVGTGTVSLYQVPMAQTAASSCTLVKAFTANETSATDFTPGNAYLKAVAATSGTDGTVVTVHCSNTQVSGGGSDANTPFDSDGDGIVDSIRVQGDYNGDGLTSPQDIDHANNVLVAAAGTSLPKWIYPVGTFSMDGETIDWNLTNRGYIELSANTTLNCMGRSVIESFSAASSYTSLSTTKPVTNDTDPSNDITVTGCKFSIPAFSAPYDASGFTSQIHYGLHFEGVTRLNVTGNEFVGSNHSCVYIRDSVDAKVMGNNIRLCGGVMEHGGDTTTLNGAVAAKAFTIALQSGDCTSWTCAVGDGIVMALDNGEWHHADVIAVSTDTLTIRPVPPSAAASGNTVFRIEEATATQNAIYFFSQDTDSIRPIAAYNVIDQVAGVGLHMRSNDNTVYARDLKFIGNTVTRALGNGVDVRGTLGGLIKGNSFDFTQGLDLLDDNAGDANYCHDDTPYVECSDGVQILYNLFTNSRYEAPNSVNGAVRWGRGHTNVKFKGNLVDGTIDGNCMAIYGNSPGSVIEENTLQNCGGDGLIDGLTVGDPITTPLVVKNTTIKDVGRSGINTIDANGIRLDLGHTGLQFDGLATSGCVDDCIAGNGSTATRGLTFRNFAIDATHSGFLGRFTEAEAAALSCDADLDQTWLMVTNATDASDCTFASGTGAAENGCYCSGGSWADFGNPTPNHKGIEFIKSTGDQDGLAFISGTVKNIPNGQEGIRIQGSGAVDNLQLRSIVLANEGDGRRSTDPIGTAIRVSSTTVTNTGISEIACGDNVNTCVGTDLDDTEVGEDSFWRSTQTPNGTCNAGAMHIETDVTTNSLGICRSDSAWDFL